MAGQSNETEIAVLRQMVERMARDYTALEVRMDREHMELENKVTALEEMAGKWKGGFLALAALGGIAGWIASVWDKVAKPWH